MPMNFLEFRSMVDPNFMSNVPATEANYVEEAKKAGKELGNVIDNIEDRTITSITNFIKKAIVLSKVFIQNSIVDDPSLDDNLNTIQNQYLAFILTALELDATILGGKTLRKLLNTVSTESYHSFDDIVFDTFGFEANGTTTNNNNNAKKINATTDINKDYKDLSISSGRVVELTFSNAAGGTTSVKIPVQLIPVILPNEVAQQVVALNFTPSFAQRKIQWSAGEISFFKDLLFNIDLIKKKKEALKKDNTGLLKEMIDDQQNAAFKTLKNLLGISKSRNVANSIYIFNKQDFMSYAHDSGLNWRDTNSRSKFFANTYSFMCVLIDPIYAKSEYYWDGFSAVGEYSAKQLKAAAKKESYDLKDIMAAFSQGNSPRF